MKLDLSGPLTSGHVWPVGAPAYAGHYRIDCVCFCLSKKPMWLHRVMCRVLLGWKWEDA